MSITWFFDDLKGRSFETPTWRYFWCFWRCLKPSCDGKQSFLHRVRIHPFAKLHFESEIRMNAIKMIICLLGCFCIILCINCKKELLSMLQSKFWFFLNFIFHGLKFLQTHVHLKMLDLNFDSRFLRSISLANFRQRLKVRIVSKSELSWLFKNSQNLDPRYPRSWEIAYI